MTPSDIQLLIMIPTNGRPAQWGLMKWLWWTCAQAPFYVAWDTFKGRPEDSARNGIVRHFLDNTPAISLHPKPRRLHYTHLLMVDDDILPPGNTHEMLFHGKSIVSGVVFTWRDNAPLALILKKDNQGGYCQDVEAIHRMNTGERLVETDASGTGCFVVEREVYENLVTNWFRFKYDEDGKCVGGEDMHFYERVREIGYKVYIDSQVMCGHIGEVDYRQVQNLLVRGQQNEVNQSNNTEI